MEGIQLLSKEIFSTQKLFKNGQEIKVGMNLFQGYMLMCPATSGILFSRKRIKKSSEDNMGKN